MFLRQFAFDSLEKLRTDRLSSAATKIQSTVRMFQLKIFYIYLKSSVLIIQKTYRMAIAKKVVRMLRRERACVKIQSVWRGYQQYTDFSTVLFLIVWSQRTFRGRKVRHIFRGLWLESKARKIQTWWRMKFHRKTLLLKRCVACNVQQLFRSRRSKRILKELRIEARSLTNVAKERDEFKKELLKMRQELEAAKSFALEVAESSTIHINHRVVGQNAVMAVHTGVISDTASVISSVYNDSLVDEVIRKDKEIERLRREIEYLKQCALLKDHISLMNSSTTELSTNEISLLDSDDPYTSTEQENHKALSDVSVCFENHIHLAVRALDDDALSVAISCTEDKTCDLNQGGHGGKNPLHYAVLNSKLSMVEYLLENECIANFQDTLGNTALHLAKSSAMIKILLEKGNANPNIPNYAGFCPIHNAVQELDVESCQILLSHGANVNVADHDRWLTPLHSLMLTSANITSRGDVSAKVFEIAKLLCEDESIAINEEDRDGYIGLHYASTMTHDRVGDVITLLLHRGSNPNVVNIRGQNSLHLLLHNRFISSFNFYEELVLLMLKQGADVNLQTRSGCTPLTLAVYHGDIEIAATFVSVGRGQLHIPWKFPESWTCHWNSNGSLDTFCLDMVRNREDMRLLIHAIRCKQTLAPPRSYCMHCRGISRRPVNCRHCGSSICSACQSGKLDAFRFPRYCDLEPSSTKHVVCKFCEEILMTLSL